VTFTAFNNGVDQYYFVDGGSAGFNVNAASFTVTKITGNDIAGNSSYSNGGPGNLDGRGYFNGSVNAKNSSPSDRSTVISFDLTDVSGSWLTDADVLAANTSGNFVAAHIGVCAFPAKGCTTTGNPLVTTAFASGATAGGVTTLTVPETSTWAMMALGFAGVGYAGFRRAKKTTVSAFA
jgi:hypothetical protein